MCYTLYTSYYTLHIKSYIFNTTHLDVLHTTHFTQPLNITSYTLHITHFYVLHTTHF